MRGRTGVKENGQVNEEQINEQMVSTDKTLKKMGERGKKGK